MCDYDIDVYNNFEMKLYIILLSACYDGLNSNYLI